MTRTLTRSLYAGAVVATMADVAAYLAWVLPGHAAETNPLVVGLAPAAAAAARLVLLLLLGCLAAIAELVPSRLLVGWISIVLSIAIVAGLTGALFTAAAVIR